MTRVLIPILLLLGGAAHANVPAAFFACEDLEPGDDCQRPAGLQGGVCVRDALCTTDEIPDVDECVLCHDACFALEPGEACVKPQGGSGVCEALGADECTENEETSFKECHRCVDGQIDKTEPDEGCEAVDAAAAIPWMLVLLIGVFQLRRRRT